MMRVDTHDFHWSGFRVQRYKILLILHFFFLSKATKNHPPSSTAASLPHPCPSFVLLLSLLCSTLAAPLPMPRSGVVWTLFVLRLFFDCIPFWKRRTNEEETKNNRRRNEPAANWLRVCGEEATKKEEPSGWVPLWRSLSTYYYFSAYFKN